MARRRAVAPRPGRSGHVRPLRRRVALLAAVLAAVVAAPGVGVPASAVTVTGAWRGASVSPAPGVAVWRERFVLDGRPQQAVFASVRLSSGRRLGVGLAGGRIGAADETTSQLTTRGRAVLGINADLFDMGGSGEPLGGLVISGEVVKSPGPRRQAQLVQFSDGRVVIGALTWTGSLTVPASAGRPAATRALSSVNTVVDAVRGGLTLVTPRLAPRSLPRGCTAVVGARRHSVAVVVSVSRGARRTPALGRGQWAVVGCRAAGTWLGRAVRVGQVRLVGRLSSPLARAGERVVTAVSGARVLVRQGRRYADPGGFVTYGRNPESFACVSADGRRLLLGVLDGRRSGAAGVTLGELTGYLLRRRCANALVFDGGGSTTLAQRAPGRAEVLNVPADWGYERPVADALLVR